MRSRALPLHVLTPAPSTVHDCAALALDSHLQQEEVPCAVPIGETQPDTDVHAERGVRKARSTYAAALTAMDGEPGLVARWAQREAQAGHTEMAVRLLDSALVHRPGHPDLQLVRQRALGLLLLAVQPLQHKCVQRGRPCCPSACLLALQDSSPSWPWASTPG